MKLDTYKNAIRNILINSGRLTLGEKVLLITDTNTKSLGQSFADFCDSGKYEYSHISIVPLSMHGEAPPPEVGPAMLEHDLIVCLTNFSLAHSDVRKAATEAGRRYLSLPDYDFDVLGSPALNVDFEAQRGRAAAITAVLDAGKKVSIESAAGTALTLSIDNRKANNCDAVLDKPGTLASPPDIEVNIAPLETTANGTIVVDGSIPYPGIGRLSDSVTLKYADGKLLSVDSPNGELENKLRSIFEKYGEKSGIIGELGFGLNPLAELTGRMLEDEGCIGTVHFGLGSNSTIGGTNRIGFHLDFVCRSPSVKVDGSAIMSNGDYIKV
jgi:leucyl aminopeptidase (aminopeptidase T)